jgi:integrase
MLPADYVTAHVELAYASTAHGAQGDTVSAAHLVIGEHTGAASAYVGMTRGRERNTAHLGAADAEQAREQWLAAFARDRADLGPTHAADLAAAEAARYAPPRPLEQVLAELREARSTEQRCLQRLAALEPQRDALAELVAAGPHPGERLQELWAAHRQALGHAEEARRRAEAAGAAVTADADRIRTELVHAWHAPARRRRQRRPGAVGRAGQVRPAPLVFTGLRGGGVLRNRIFRRAGFDRAATALGLDGLVPHELRHTAASLAVSSGANVKAVQRMLGHASAALTLDTYTDLFDDDLDAVAERLDVAARAARGLPADFLRTAGPDAAPQKPPRSRRRAADQRIHVVPPAGFEPAHPPPEGGQTTNDRRWLVPVEVHLRRPAG